MRRRRTPRSGEKILPPIFPNAGIRAAYRRKLQAIIEEMANSYEHWLRATYRSNPPRMMALDEIPSRELERQLRQLGIRWEKRFEELAPKLAKFFAQKVHLQCDRRLKAMLREGGVTVRLTMTPALRDVLQATVTENVGLIKSIQSQYHTQVQGLVMRSVTEGRDLHQLTRDLQARFGITEDRAKFIALDQSNKATSVIRRERETSVGIETGLWMHSHAGREPRKTHLANDGEPFNLKTGWYDPDPKVRKRIWPGMLVNCRCTWKAVVKGFS